MAIARALARSPQLLVLDDISSGLDNETEATLWHALRANTDLTILAVSHSREALRHAERIVLVDDQRVVDTGSLNSLLRKYRLMRQLWAESE